MGDGASRRGLFSGSWPHQSHTGNNGDTRAGESPPSSQSTLAVMHRIYLLFPALLTLLTFHSKLVGVILPTGAST
jgi:hypothetical protein